MASSKEYLEFILGQLSDLNEITYRAMMGEFVIYYRGKIVAVSYTHLDVYKRQALHRPGFSEQHHLDADRTPYHEQPPEAAEIREK